MKSRKVRRLSLVNVLVILGLMFTLFASAVAAQTINVSVGRLPWGALNTVVTEYMIANELFEKEARALGYEITVDWRDYPSAQPQVEAMMGDRLDIGLWGNTPVVRNVSLDMPIAFIGLGEGHLDFQIAVRPDSDIKSLEDLKGKNVGTLLGADPHFFLSMLLEAEFGTANPEALGINIINVPSYSQLASMPRGVDAVTLITPSFLQGRESGSVEGLVSNYGLTLEHYDGPLGKGAGIKVPSVERSDFYPEGYYLHRTMWVARQGFVDRHPDLVVAFLVAHEKALQAVSKMSPGDASRLAYEYWELPPELGGVIVADDLLYLRGWSWLTHGDVRSIVANSEFMVKAGLIENAVSWEKVKQYASRVAPLIKRAYEIVGAPSPDTFFDGDAIDLRGAPIWEYESW